MARFRPYSEMLENIRHKYTGTAEEHDFLRDTLSDLAGMEDRLSEQYQLHIDNIEENGRKNAEMVSRFWSLASVEVCLINWIRDGAREDDFYLDKLVSALSDRKVTLEHLELITKKFRDAYIVEESDEKEQTDPPS